MKKLKGILQHNYIFYILLIFVIINTIICINVNPKSIYNENINQVYGYVLDYKIKDDKLTIYIKSKEKLLINYYSNDIKDISYGDYIKVKGEFVIPNANTNFNLFNYKKYLLSKKVKYMVNADKIVVINKNTNIYYKLKNILINRINNISKSNSYIKTFLFADKNYIDDESIKNYQKLGISHLLAVSGMHVSLVSIILLKLLSNLSENKKYIIISIVLFIYMFLTNYTISMVRSCFQFVLFFINKSLKLNIKNENIVIFILSVLLLFNPYYIYDIGFKFSFIISFSLIRFNCYIMNENILIKLLKVSLISFLVSLPILINNFYQINILSIIFNIFYVPFISYIIFPLNLLTLLFPFLDGINYFFIYLFENISKILSQINVLTFNVAKIPVALIIIYYIVIYKLLINFNIKNILKCILLILLFIFYKSYLFIPIITYINVNQGDSSLIRIHNKNILIDTGGVVSFNTEKSYNLTDNVLLPYFKSEGVKKIDYLILTHGDYDHMGEAINLVENFKVEKVIFNCGPYNDLEQELIKVLDKKKIKYYSCIKELNIDNNKLYFLQTKEYDNENNNSNVIFTELNDYKFMFMGDAGIEKEKDILDKYNISDIDVLKVGHHGSKTSSSKEFIDDINPKYSVISVGKKNRYGHPNKEVLDVLSNSKIYRTDEDGSIMFKIKNNKLKIKTCEP